MIEPPDYIGVYGFIVATKKTLGICHETIIVSSYITLIGARLTAGGRLTTRGWLTGCCSSSRNIRRCWRHTGECTILHKSGNLAIDDGHADSFWQMHTTAAVLNTHTPRGQSANIFWGHFDR